MLGQPGDHFPDLPGLHGRGDLRAAAGQSGTAATRASTSSFTLFENSVPSKAMPVAIPTWGPSAIQGDYGTWDPIDTGCARFTRA